MDNEMTDLDYYFKLLIAKDAGLIFLCVFGAVLNGVMLYMLVSKKQVRSSVHTVYMVQIALTDLLVCIVWLVLTCLMTNQLLQNSGQPPDYVSNETEESDDNSSDVVSSPFGEALTEDASSEQYRMWRIMYSWYNFHYYTNIFLLACMSVERCAAVWKSMRCQRYQYNRKAIYTVSVFMWLTALAFVMPNFVDPDMIVSDSDSAPGLSRDIRPMDMPSVSPDAWTADSDSALSQVFHGRTYEDNEIVVLPSGKLDNGEPFVIPADDDSIESSDKVYQTDLEVLFECYTLLLRAIKQNRDHVTDHGGISVQGCVFNIMGIMNAYSPEFRDGITPPEEDDGPLAEPTYSSDYSPDDINFPDSYTYDDSYYDEDLPSNAKPPGGVPGEGPAVFNDSTHRVDALERDFYRVILTDAVRTLIEHRHKTALNEACDPQLTTTARIYILTVNLVLGFFIPFAVIVFSYVSIAYMIGKRARSRMNPHMSEASTTNFTAHYLQNPSTTNIPLAYLRDKPRNRQTDSMGRRMSDFMKYVLLRKPQEGADNGTYWTDSDRDCTPYDSMQKMPLTSSSRRLDDHSGEGANYEVGHGASRGVLVRIRSKFARRNKPAKGEDDPPYQGDQQAAGCHDEVKLRNNYEQNGEKVKLPLRAKKYSFCYDATNEHIPQTIAEHPHETEENMEDAEFLSASHESFPNDTSKNPRAHAALLLMQRNSRRESGGSYGSSVDSAATDQTLMTSLGHDKRYSAATTMSALTPPTPVESGNPSANAFFPQHDDKVPYARSQSAEPPCPHPENQHGGHDQRLHRPPQKPGSQLNDITLKLYRKSLQKLQHEETDTETTQKALEHGADTPGTSSDYKDKAAAAAAAAAKVRGERYSYPRMNRSQSVPEERMNAIRGPRPSKSSNRIAGDLQRLSNGEEPQSSYYPKYNRQVSSSSTVFFTRGRTFSTTSRGSMGTNTLRKTMARKNAERHLRVSRTVLAYVIVFSICWLPQRIVYLLYVLEALMGTPPHMCVKLISGTRLVSFVSVLLNPIVYIVTQRDLRAYVRKSWLVQKLRHWYAKCFKKPVERPYERESEMRPPTNGSSNRNNNAQDMELQLRPDVIDNEESSGHRQANSNRVPFRLASPTRPVIHARRNSGGPHEIFTAAGALTARRRDATIDEMKEEEAAAEESLEKEMNRLAAMAEEEKRRAEDKQNKNWPRSPSDDVITDNSGSGNKTSSSGKSDQSSVKGENFEEFWVRWLQSGGADLLTPSNGELSNSTPSEELDARMAELGQIVLGKNVADPNHGMDETII